MLDPIADKVLVAVALMMLVAEGTFSQFKPNRHASLLRLVPALIILSREILVSGLREFLAGTRVSVPVTTVAKFKTAVQMIAIGAMILTPLADRIRAGHSRAHLCRDRLSAAVGGGGADRLYRRDLFQERAFLFAARRHARPQTDQRADWLGLDGLLAAHQVGIGVHQRFRQRAGLEAIMPDL